MNDEKQQAKLNVFPPLSLLEERNTQTHTSRKIKVLTGTSLTKIYPYT